MLSRVVDFRGYFHMDELVRKTARELISMGFVVLAPPPAVLRTSIGTRVGTWNSVVSGTKDGYVANAGAAKKLIGFWPFGCWVTGRLTVAFAGEGYEDFRRNVGIPFFTTATATITSSVDTRLDWKTQDPGTLQSLLRRPRTYSQGYHQAMAAMEAQMANAVERLAGQMAATSFTRECAYCKSMFVGEASCPYCGAPQSQAPRGSLIEDRGPAPPGTGPWGP